MDVVIGWIVICGAIMLYLLPAIVASKRKHRNAGAICVFNMLLGWSLIGWALSLVWACTDNVEPERA